MTTSPWTEEQDALALRRWAEGMSAAVIGRELGVSRAAVMGRIARRQKRLGHIERAASTRTRRPKGSNLNGHRLRAAKRAAKRVIVQPPAPETASTAYGKPCGLVELTANSCRWPIGDGPYLFCNAEHAHGEPYCERHLAAAWRT